MVTSIGVRLTEVKSVQLESYNETGDSQRGQETLDTEAGRRYTIRSRYQAAQLR
jgi:hypothetical protein